MYVKRRRVATELSELIWALAGPSAACGAGTSSASGSGGSGVRGDASDAERARDQTVVEDVEGSTGQTWSNMVKPLMLIGDDTGNCA